MDKNKGIHRSARKDSIADSPGLCYHCDSSIEIGSEITTFGPKRMHRSCVNAAIKYYKVCRIRCRKCGDVLEYVNKVKLSRGMLRYCSCGAVGLDPAAIMYRTLGNPEDYEDMSEEWDDEAEALVEQVTATMAMSGFTLSEEDKARIRYVYHNPDEVQSILDDLIEKHTVDMRLYEHKKNPITYTHEEVMESLGITQADLDEIEVEIEEED